MISMVMERLFVKKNHNFWVKYDKYKKPLRHEQKQLGRSVKLKSKPIVYSTVHVNKKFNVNYRSNWKFSDQVTYLGKI